MLKNLKYFPLEEIGIRLFVFNLIDFVDTLLGICDAFLIDILRVSSLNEYDYKYIVITVYAKIMHFFNQGEFLGDR